MRPIPGQRTSYLYRKSVNNVPVNKEAAALTQKNKTCQAPNLSNGNLAVPKKYVNNDRNIRPVLFVRRFPEATTHEIIESLVPGKLDD